MKSNILLVGFLKDLNEKICTELAKSFNMYVADVPGLIAYELMNLDEMITVCGKEYYDHEEQKVVARMSTFENTIFNINYDLFYLYGKKYFKDSAHIIYVRVDESKLNEKIRQNGSSGEWSAVIDLIDYRDRDKYLCGCANYVAENDKLNSNSYSKKIKDYFEKISK